MCSELISKRQKSDANWGGSGFVIADFENVHQSIQCIKLMFLLVTKYKK